LTAKGSVIEVTLPEAASKVQFLSSKNYLEFWKKGPGGHPGLFVPNV
jgi:hypothetical protein